MRRLTLAPCLRPMAVCALAIRSRVAAACLRSSRVGLGLGLGLGFGLGLGLGLGLG